MSETSFWNTLKLELVKHSARYVVISVFAAIGFAGLWAWKIFVEGIGAFQIPPGAVLAFDLEKCPTIGGWENLEDVNAHRFSGRMLVVSGEPFPREGNLDTSRRKPGDEGGSETKKLSVHNIPGHTHDFHFNPKVRVTVIPTENPKTTVVMRSHTGGKTKDVQLKQRLDPFDIMPPFTVMTFCKKK